MPERAIADGTFFRTLFASAADAIVVVDGSGTIVLANAACGPLFGHDPVALAGKSVETLVPARFSGHARQRQYYGVRPFPRPMGRGLQLFAVHADGREIPVDISLSPFTLEGRPFVACALRDQRGISRGPDALRVQATALRSAANGVVITDREGTITWVNPAACAITGYSEDELVGRAHANPEVRPARARVLRQPLEDRDARRVVVRHDREPAQGRHRIPGGADDRARARRERRDHSLHRDQAGRHRTAPRPDGARARQRDACGEGRRRSKA